MSDSYTKLFSSITESTIWGEPAGTRLVWITMLAKCNRKGEFFGSIPGLARLANVTMEECEAAVQTLLAPDRWSRTPDHEGRRIEAIDRGWRILNHAKFDKLRSEIEAEERERERKREWDRENRPSGYARSKEEKSDESPTKSDNSPSQSVTPPAASVDSKKERAKSKAVASPENPAQQSPTFINLILNDGSEYPITDDQVREFSDLFPAVDTKQAFREMRSWCVTNAGRRKTRGGIMRFVHRWLGKAQNESRENFNARTVGNRRRNDGAAGQVQAAIDERRAAENRFTLDG